METSHQSGDNDRICNYGIAEVYLGPVWLLVEIPSESSTARGI